MNILLFNSTLKRKANKAERAYRNHVSEFGGIIQDTDFVNRFYTESLRKYGKIPDSVYSELGGIELSDNGEAGIGVRTIFDLSPDHLDLVQDIASNQALWEDNPNTGLKGIFFDGIDDVYETELTFKYSSIGEYSVYLLSKQDSSAVDVQVPFLLLSENATVFKSETTLYFKNISSVFRINGRRLSSNVASEASASVGIAANKVKYNDLFCVNNYPENNQLVAFNSTVNFKTFTSSGLINDSKNKIIKLSGTSFKGFSSVLVIDKIAFTSVDRDFYKTLTDIYYDKT
ncbi:hypothetical protein GW932_02970 [archaeon]|nr:hypothetical protein [archaeon]